MSVAEKNYEASDFVKFWNEVLRDKFNRHQNILMNGLSYHSRVPLEQIDWQAGSHIVDIGCGWGDTALALAQKVGPKGRVVGMDCVDDFMNHGRQLAQKHNINNISFIDADVEIYPFKGNFDYCFSRFGMMFFTNPVFALRNIRAALKPCGELIFIVWRTIDDNPWFGIPKQTVLKHLPAPDGSGQTCGPGPFSMAGQDMVTQQLHAAGFVDVEHQRNDGKVMVGRDIEQAIDFQLSIGPAGEIYREAGQLALERSAEIKADLSDALSPHLNDTGVWMDSSSWTIRCRKPK